jgi:hypothetical protein
MALRSVLATPLFPPRVYSVLTGRAIGTHGALMAPPPNEGSCGEPRASTVGVTDFWFFF